MTANLLLKCHVMALNYSLPP